MRPGVHTCPGLPACRRDNRCTGSSGCILGTCLREGCSTMFYYRELTGQYCTRRDEGLTLVKRHVPYQRLCPKMRVSGDNLPHPWSKLTYFERNVFVMGIVIILDHGARHAHGAQCKLLESSSGFLLPTTWEIPSEITIGTLTVRGAQ